MRSERRRFSVFGGLGAGLFGGRTFAALDSVNLEVRRGEMLGIIGMNGSGKSTLLKIVAGICAPTEGTVEVRGRVSSLIELGAGFHPELSGYENVHLNGTILGIERSAIDDLLPRIVEFSGLEGFMDMPVKHYSSGMYMRLGFAIAIQLRPDVLLLDETMAVGDAQFQSRALRAVHDFKATGATTLMVSHDIFTLREYSDRIVWLDKGRVAGIGDPQRVVEEYRYFLAQLGGRRAQTLIPLRGDQVFPEPCVEDSPVRIVSLDVLDSQDRSVETLDRPERVALSIRYECTREVPGLRVRAVLVHPKDKSIVLEKDSVRDGIEIGALGTEGEIRFSFESGDFLSDTFEFIVAFCPLDDPNRILDRAALRFELVGLPQTTPETMNYLLGPCRTFEHNPDACKIGENEEVQDESR